MKNKVVVVTGAAGVICSMIAKHFAKLGAKVAMLDLNYEKAKEYEEEFDISKLNPKIEFSKRKVQNGFCIKCRLF